MLRVLLVVVFDRDTHTMNVVIVYTNLQISRSHIEHFFLQLIDKVIHV